MENFISDYYLACAKLNRSTELPDVSMYSPKKQTRLIADHKLETILEANNDGWEGDLADTSQRKWHPYFDIIKDKGAPGGFRLSFFVSVFDLGYSFVGVRHACKNRELSDFMGQNCPDLYREVRG